MIVNLKELCVLKLPCSYEPNCYTIKQLTIAEGIVSFVRKLIKKSKTIVFTNVYCERITITIALQIITDMA